MIRPARDLPPIKADCGHGVCCPVSDLSFGAVVGPSPLIVVLLLLLPTGVWLRWCARRLLMAEVVRPEAHALEELKDGTISNALCLVPSSLEVDRVIEGGWCQRVSVLTGALPAAVDGSRPLVDGLFPTQPGTSSDA